jgi:putative tricarboxylic transport membrane protein
VKIKIQDYAGSLFLLGIGFYVCIGGCKVGFGTFQEPGAGFIFIFCGSVLIILSVIDLLTIRFKRVEYKRTIWTVLNWQKVVLVVAGLSAYVYLFEWLGFVLSTFLLLLFLYRAVEPTKWWTAALWSLITILVSYIIFRIWLGVSFPKGFVGI